MNFKTSFLLAICSLMPLHGMATNDKDNASKRWSLQASFGGTTLTDNTPDGQDFYMGDEEGNYFALSADYFLKNRLALTGGLYYEQEGIATYYASGIGLKKVNMLGIEGGIKWYFFPQKWIIQPHIGALVQTNFLNLGHMKGSEEHELKQGYPGSPVQLDDDVLHWRLSHELASTYASSAQFHSALLMTSASDYGDITVPMCAFSTIHSQDKSAIIKPTISALHLVWG